jgi:hypothetical protein
MRALKLVQHMKANADRISEELIQRIRNSDRCGELIRKLPAEEQKRYGLEIYGNLMDWLGEERDSLVESRYVDLGIQRANQGVPFSEMFWAVCIARDYLWDYMQQECLLEEPVEFWGGVILLRSLNQFFDRALYFTLIGYQKAGKGSIVASIA